MVPRTHRSFRRKRTLPSSQEEPEIPLRQRFLALLLIFSFLCQPLVHLAHGYEPMLPIAYFAPVVKEKPTTPFLWVAPAPASHYLKPQSGKKPAWPSLWTQKPRSEGSLLYREVARPPVEPWQPTDELSPLIPPDGMPVDPANGFAGPFPGIIDAVGNCVVFGEVSDGLEPVAAAFVDVVGTGKTAQTDASGKFTIQGLAPGTYTLEATKLGYFAESAVTTALEGQPAEVRFGLRAKPSDNSESEFLMDEETVVGEYQGDSQGDFNLELTLEAPALTSSMGREEFAKTGVSDAGEAISKISGANIVDGKYAVVRGLAERYVTTTFNGGQIASADPSRKAVQLDLFPTSSIEQIRVDKTYSPQLPGDFGGGAIDIITRSMPEERILQMSTKVSYNDSLEDKIFTRGDNKLGFFGDIGKELPNVLETENGFINTSELPNSETAELWKTLHNSQNMRPKEVSSNLEYSQSFTYGDTFELPNNMRLGFMSAFSQKSNDSSNSTEVTNQTREFLRDEYSRNVEWAAYLSSSLEINEHNRVNATYFNKHIAGESVSNATRIIDDEENLNYGNHLKNSTVNSLNDYGPDAIYYGAAWDISPLERDLEIFQMTGTHRLHDRGTRFDWGFTNSNALENRPHSTHLEYGVLDFSTEALSGVIAQSAITLDNQAVAYARLLRLPNPESYTWETIRDPMYARPNTRAIYDNFGRANTIIPDDSRPPVETLEHGTYSGSVPGKQRSTRRSEKTTEEAEHRHLSATVPFYFSEDDDDRYFEFGFGAATFKKERETKARQYDLGLSLNSPSAPGFPPGALVGPGGLGEQFAADPSLISDYFNGTLNTGPYYRNTLTLNGLENINTSLEQEAIFYSGMLRLGKSFLSGGVRFEKESYEIDILASPYSAFSDAQIEGNGWERRDPLEAILPSVTAGTSIFEDRLSFMFAWSKTVARPTFWEFIPSQTLDQATGLARRGNNFLGQTEIDNIDLGLTWQPNDSSTIRLSLFHKDLVNPLVNFFDSGTLTYADSFRSLTGEIKDFTATISGIEVEAELNKIGPFSLRGNFTYIDASLDYFLVQNGVEVAVNSRLPYQPTYLANLNLGYTYEPWKLNANFIYNYNGDYPVILKLTPEDSEVTRESISTFDLVVSKLIETETVDYTIKAGVKNIFNATDVYLFSDSIYDSDSAGRSFWMEIQLSF